MKEELLTLLQHLDSSPVFGGTFVPYPCSFLCVLCCFLFVVVLCLVCPVLTVSLDCLFPSCILCAQCWQCIWIVCFHPVSCVSSVDSVSGLFVSIMYLVCPVFTVSLDCLFPSCILCAQCWQCLWIICFHPVSCVSSVDSVSGLFVSILYLVFPVFTVSLDCLTFVNGLYNSAVQHVLTIWVT